MCDRHTCNDTKHEANRKVPGYQLHVVVQVNQTELQQLRILDELASSMKKLLKK